MTRDDLQRALGPSRMPYKEQRDILAKTLEIYHEALNACWLYIATGPHHPGQQDTAIILGRDALALWPEEEK